jgi:hypothetical protein
MSQQKTSREFHCRECDKKQPFAIGLNLKNYQTWICDVCGFERKLCTKEFLTYKRPANRCPKCSHTGFEYDDSSILRDASDGSKVTVIHKWECYGCPCKWATFETVYFTTQAKITESLRRGSHLFKRFGKLAYVDNFKNEWHYLKSPYPKRKKKSGPLRIELKEKLHLKDKVMPTTSYRDLAALPFRRVYEVLQQTANPITSRLWLRVHGITIPNKISRNMSAILRDKGYGANIEERVKNTEQLILLLRKLLIIFNFNKTLLAEYLIRFHWKTRYANIESLRKDLDEYGLFRPWYNTKLDREQRRNCVKILHDIWIHQEISDLKTYYREKQVEELVQKALNKYVFSRPKRLRKYDEKVGHYEVEAISNEQDGELEQDGNVDSEAIERLQLREVVKQKT